MFIKDYAKIASRVCRFDQAVVKLGQLLLESDERFAVSQEEICCRALRRRVMLASRSEG